jgi:hypothetical protein
MTAIHETAYPRIRSTLSDKELEEVYTPTPGDLTFLHRVTKSTVALFGGRCFSRPFNAWAISLPLTACRPG